MTSRSQRFAKSGVVEGKKDLPSPRRRNPKPGPADPGPDTSTNTSHLPALLSGMPLDLLGRSAWPINEVIVRLAGLHPVPKFQAIAKFRDRTKAWAVWVDEDPAVALLKVLEIALKGPDFAEGHSLIRFYDRRAKAEEQGEKIVEANRDLIWNMHVEFEPYVGYVAVVFLRAGADLQEAHQRFGLLCEIREADQTHSARGRAKEDGLVHQPRAGGGGDKTPSKSGRRRAQTSEGGDNTAQPVKGRTTPKNEGVTVKSLPVSDRPTREELEPQKKSALIKIHQGLFGKQPNNKLSPEEIIDLIMSKLPEE